MVNISNKRIQDILSFFFLNPKRRLYLRQLSEDLSIDKGNLSRYLVSLVEEGVLSAEEDGQRKYFFLNGSYPLLSELKRMTAGDVKPEHLLKKKLAKVSGLESAYIFGSYAAGNFGKQSDIDLLLIGSHSPMAARSELVVLQKRLGREINAIDYTREEYKEKMKDKDGFLAKVISGPKIILK